MANSTGLSCAATLAFVAPLMIRSAPDEVLRFVVLGHEPHMSREAWDASLDELEVQLRQQAPDLAFLTGDWLNVDTPDVEASWAEVDARFADNAIPLYRVPGDAEISSGETHERWNDRYGVMPRAIERENALFLLLSTLDPVGQPRAELDGLQRAFLQAELEDTEAEHVFVISNGAPWWDREASWWSDVHPLLVEAGVRAVFAAQAPETRFASAAVDGVRYVLSRVGPAERDDAFNHFVDVSIDGDDVAYEVRTLAAVEHDRRSPPGWPSEAAGALRTTRSVSWRDPGVLGWVLRISGAAFLTGVVLTLTVVTLFRIWRRQAGAR